MGELQRQKLEPAFQIIAAHPFGNIRVDSALQLDRPVHLRRIPEMSEGKLAAR